MGSAALVFTMGRFLGHWTLGLVTACLIVLVNSNIDHNLKELGQDDGLFRGLLDINPNKLRWKRAAEGGKKLKGSKKAKTKKSQARTNKSGVKGGKKKKSGTKSTKKRSNSTKGKKKLNGKRIVNKAKKNNIGGKKWKGNKKIKRFKESQDKEVSG